MGKGPSPAASAARSTGPSPRMERRIASSWQVHSGPMNRFFILVGVLVAAVAQAEPVTYRIDAERSEVVALTKPAGMGAGLSHPHVVEAKGLEGQIVYDAAAPERSSIEISAPTAKLVNDD